jgi:small conductance mechanosensitive channel
MSLVSTTISTADNQIQIVPNGAIWGGVITNSSANSTRRVDLVASVSYRDDVDQAQKLFERLVAEHPKVLKDPAPVVRLNKLGESSLDFVVRPWVKAEDYWTVYWDLTRSFKVEVERAGMSIPFPHRVLLMDRSDKAEKSDRPA